jgi:hypothetical protein
MGGVQGSRFRVQGSGFKVQGSGFKVAFRTVARCLKFMGG